MASVYTLADQKTIEQEAREWLIRLDGGDEPSQDDIAALREWVDRSPAHREELTRLSIFWNDANILTELSIPLHPKAVNTGLGFVSALSAFKRVGAVAVVCLLTVGIAMSIWLHPSEDTVTNDIYATAIGEIQLQTLADGSVIQINTDSQVQVDYDNGRRKLWLLRGEAHFDVAHNPNWPFEVYAGKGMVKAVGTAFSVRLRKDKVKVIVTEGSVDVATLVDEPTAVETTLSTHDASGLKENKGDMYKPVLKKIGTLGEGQTATFSNQIIHVDQSPDDKSYGSLIGDVTTLAQQELDRQLSWRKGYLVFAGDPLSHVVDEVSRYTPVTIDIIDPALRQIRIGGRFKVGELSAMLDVLEASFGIQISRLSDQHIQLLPAQ